MESTSEVVSNTVTHKNDDDVNEQPEPKNESVEVQETITIKKRVENVSEDVKEDQTNDEDIEAAEQVVTVTVTSTIEKEQIESSSGDEEELVEESNVENEKNVHKIVIENVAGNTIDSPNGKETETVKKTTVTQETPNGTKTVSVTTTQITKEEAPTTTTVITTHSTPATEETFVENKEFENEKSSKVEENILEPDEEDEEDEEDDEVESEQEENDVKEDEKLNENNEDDRTVVGEKETPEQEKVQPPEPPQQSNVKEETVVDAPSSLIHANQSNINNKQDNINNTLKNIISSIDSNINAEENIAALKEREIELIKKQQELAKEIQQQQIIAQQFNTDNQFRQEEMNNKFNRGNNECIVAQKAYQPVNNISKYSTYEEKQDENMYTRKSETFETRQSTDVSKKIDLHKIFTPATDAEEILPKNRKLYASSAFYSPTLHPTVEDQVELARRISHSLSDISNQQSRGQSMYVNRKKRSVKWVHEGCGQDYHQYQIQPKPSTSPSILPAYTDAAKHRVQLNLHQEQLMEKYAKPGLKVVQTPWEAALNSGSASTAFVEENNRSPFPTSILTPSPTPQIYDSNQGGVYQQSPTPVADIYNKPSGTDDYNVYQPTTKSCHLPQVQSGRQQYSCATNSQRELAYKPSIPQGWKAPGMSLPKDLYMPKEIPIQSYAPPPAMAIPLPVSPFTSNVDYEIKESYGNKSTNASSPFPYLLPEPLAETKKSFGGGSNTFPINNSYQQGFSSTFGHKQPPKQQYLPPQSYQTVSQNSNQNVPQVNFNPSPLPYDKLAKFENPPTDNGCHAISPNRNYHQHVRGSEVRNTSTTAFAGSHHRPYTPTSESYNYGGTHTSSPRPKASFGRYTPNPCTNISNSQILNAPTYNSLARGWRCSDSGSNISTGYQALRNHVSTPIKYPSIVNAASIPYTDF